MLANVDFYTFGAYYSILQNYKCVCVCVCVQALDLRWMLLSHSRPDMVIYCHSLTSQILSYHLIPTSAPGPHCMSHVIILINQSINHTYPCVNSHILYVCINVSYLNSLVALHTYTYTYTVSFVHTAWTLFIFTVTRPCHPAVEH